MGPFGRRVHVIILAQGNQSRMGDLGTPKQFLPLPACGGMPILLRTLLQVGYLDHFQDTLVTVVCHPHMAPDILALSGRRTNTATGKQYTIEAAHLPDPGNSSLKGIARYLDNAISRQHLNMDATVVLLGDVVYSWHCLDVLFGVGSGKDPSRDVVVATTSDLSQSGGELWGLSWTTEWEPYMKGMLSTALDKHPPFHDTYQPGQMRQWFWAMPIWSQELAHVAVDDYTRDVDLPAHVAMLPDLSLVASRDDAAHGMPW